VAVKVDREEHPDVDAGYLAAASAFTQNLGWPLTVFATPDGRVFFAGTYFPPEPRRGQSSFAQVLDAVSEAWIERRSDVEQTAAMVASALGESAPAASEVLPDAGALEAAVAKLAGYEDGLFGGFGSAPKFPVAPVLGFLLSRPDGVPIAARALQKMAASALRDPIEGGFFRYAVQRDWSDPHYERMLYDNALLLRAYADAAIAEPSTADFGGVADGIASFLLARMRLPTGGFASAQDSESTVDGERVEGGYYALNAEERAGQVPPARDEKVLTGWNGLAIGALAHAGLVLDRPEWIAAAGEAADALLTRHRRADGTLARASIGDRVSEASATLEDYGMFASGLLDLAMATGTVGYSTAARELVDATLAADGSPFGVPGGSDPVLTARGLVMPVDPSEGAYPSGLSATGQAANTLYLLTADQRYADAARAAMRLVAHAALESPISFGSSLELMSALDAEPAQLVVIVASADPAGSTLVDAARRAGSSAKAFIASEAQAQEFAASGFDLFAARTSIRGLTTAYLCRDFVCRLPTTDADELAAILAERPGG
jgi:uncharacterized protein YyaL (SSP411 family)